MNKIYMDILKDNLKEPAANLAANCSFELQLDWGGNSWWESWLVKTKIIVRIWLSQRPDLNPWNLLYDENSLNNNTVWKSWSSFLKNTVLWFRTLAWHVGRALCQKWVIAVSLYCWLLLSLYLGTQQNLLKVAAGAESNHVRESTRQPLSWVWQTLNQSHLREIVHSHKHFCYWLLNLMPLSH